MIYEIKAGGVDHRRLVGAKLDKLAEGDSGMVKNLKKILNFSGLGFFFWLFWNSSKLAK